MSKHHINNKYHKIMWKLYFKINWFYKFNSSNNFKANCIHRAILSPNINYTSDAGIQCTFLVWVTYFTGRVTRHTKHTHTRRLLSDDSCLMTSKVRCWGWAEATSPELYLVSHMVDGAKCSAATAHTRAGLDWNRAAKTPNAILIMDGN